MVFHWSLSDSKSPQISMTLLSILSDLNNVIVWIVSPRPVISKSSTPCTNPFVTAPRAPIMISITVTFMFHNFFKSADGSAQGVVGDGGRLPMTQSRTAVW